MSLVLLSHACSHLQNASRARLGLTSIPCTTMLHTLLISLQHSGYVSNVAIGGPQPPGPSALNPTFSQLHIHESASSWSDDGESDESETPVASRRLWIGLKYWNNEPVLRGMAMVSKPTRRVWMGVPEMLELARGNQQGYVKGIRGVGESMYVTTDRGIFEVRECVERKVGGMLLCRVNPF